MGSLGFENFETYPDQESKRVIEIANNGGAPDELQGTYSGNLLCDNARCLQRVAMLGDWRYWINEGDPKYGQFGAMYKIRQVHPPLRLIAVPDRAPDEVKSAISTASSAIWISPSLAANQLRQAVEDLLTAKRVRRTSIKATTGKRNRLNLHTRIREYAAKEPKIAEALEAVKWIGNSGSHDDKLTVAEVLVGAEILELALKSLYDKSDAQLLSKVRAINRTKGKVKTT
ncbi:hypothetical protein ASE64_11590 [Agreia sp. Leaf210]|nr:hypothetical protein ASE64_11590 [Agreia sp. Leaf210]